MSTSTMYLVITTAIWMNKTSNKPKTKITGSAQNVPFGVFGVMLPYKTVRSTHFSNLCVRISTKNFIFKVSLIHFRQRWILGYVI